MTSVRLQVHSGLEERVVDLRCPDDVTVAQLREGAPTGLLPESLVIDQHVIRDEHSPTPLTTGSTLHPARGSSGPSAPGPMLEVLVISGPQQRRRFPLPDGTFVLGRQHPLLVGDDAASRKHLALSCHHGHVQVCDLGSANGTLLDHRRLTPHQPSDWRLNEPLHLGTSTLLLQLRASESSDPKTPGRTAAAEPRPVPPRPQVFTWPTAPSDTAQTRLRWLTALAPVPVALVMTVWLGSPIFLVMMLLSPLTMIVLGWDGRREARRTFGSKQRQWREDVRHSAHAVNDALTQERTWLRTIAPDPENQRRVGPRPVRIRAPDDDATLLALRLGQGESTSMHRVQVERGRHFSPRLEREPVVLPLPREAHLHVHPDRVAPEAALRLLLAGLLAHLATGDVRVRVVTAADLGVWVNALAGVEHVRTVTADLVTRWTSPTPLGETSTVHTILLVDTRITGASALTRSVERQTTVITVGQTGSAAADVQVTVAPGFHASTLRTATDVFTFTMDDPAQPWFDELTRRQVRAQQDEDAGPGAGLVPQHQALSVLPRTMAQLWREPPSLRVPVAASADGPFVLDLATVGPHALVAGTTGSGKSEFLITLLLELFRRNAPAQVSALLIDYKGGATFGQLAQAPHVTGVITDLDAGLAERSLTGLKAEIRRREQLLARAGYASYNQAAADGFTEFGRFLVVIDEFRVLAEEIPDFVAGMVRLAAIGRSLGIHVVLATQRPGGVVTADIRANLDVRVCLRVREPADSSEVVGVTDAASISKDTPGRALIASGSDTPVAVQTAHSGTAPLPPDEVHWHVVSGRPLPCPACERQAGSDDPPHPIAQFVAEANDLASGLPRPHRPVLPPLPSEVSSDALASASEDGAISMVGLTDFTPTLNSVDDAAPDPASTLTHAPSASAPPDGPAPNVRNVIAVADLPEHQAQPLVTLDGVTTLGISGAPRSGRTSALARIAQAACATSTSTSPSASSASDLTPGASSSGVRTDVRLAAPSTQRDAIWHHLGTPQFASDDPHQVAQLLEWLAQDAAQGDVLLVDDWDVLSTTLLQINRGLGGDQMLDLIRQASSRGVRIVIAGGRSVIASRLASLLEARIVLRHNDPSEYSLAGLRPVQIPSSMPAGRALVLPYARAIQFVPPEAEL